MDSSSSIRHRSASSARPAEAAPAPGPELVAPQEVLLDTEGLGRDLAALPAGPGLRAAATVLLGRTRAQGFAAIAAALEREPHRGLAAARSYAWLTDRLVGAALDTAASRLHRAPMPTAAERLAVLALGGYGRAEMAPCSDVDLLFLTPWKQTAWSESVIESAQYMLTDARVMISPVVRSIEDCLRLSRADLTIRTAHLDRRFLHGDRGLADELGSRLWKEVFARTGPGFVEAKLAERDARHQRHGGSRYLLEPNIKEGKGGLRDLQTLYWIANYLYRTTTSAELVARGVFTEGEAASFDAAAAFLWTVRCHLHLIAGRAVEQLSFDMQVEIARRLGFADRDGRRGVEIFMQTYFTHARNVGELTRIACAFLEARHVKKRVSLGPRLRRAFGFGRGAALAPGFARIDGRLGFADDAALAREPLLILRLFQEALRTGLLLHPAALRAVTARLDLARALAGNPAAAAVFLDLLLGTSNPERALRRMNETGVLGAFLPEFGEVVCLMQFNMYHHYTVDEHSLTCVSVLSQIERGELSEELPVVSGILAEGVDRLVIYLAVLLHDVGKARAGDHSVTGAAMAEAACRRLGVGEERTALVVWLVRNHLLMSDFAQKRDISDPGTLRAFAEAVGSLERLRLLCVLTVADIMGVGPGVWNNWKAQLLRQLFRSARAAITGEVEEGSRAARETAAKAAFAESYGRTADPAAVAEECGRHYAPYWLGFDTATQVGFARMDEAILAGEIAVSIEPDPSRDATRAMFYMEDHPGIFARMAGALALAGANVVDARTYTSSDGFATMAFWVQDRAGNPYESSRLGRLRKTVDKALKGGVPIGEEFRARFVPKRREKDFTVPTRIVFDNDESDIYTIIEVSARDRPGLLYDLTRTLAANGISISSAVIATYGAQAVDAFYVKDVFGLKVTPESKKRTVEARLRAAIEGTKPER